MDANFVDVVAAGFPHEGVVLALCGEMLLVVGVKVEVCVDLAIGDAVFVEFSGKIGFDARRFGFHLGDAGFLDFDRLKEFFGGEVTEQSLRPLIFAACGIEAVIFDALIEICAVMSAQDHHHLAFDLPVGSRVQSDLALCHIFGGGLERGLDQPTIIDCKSRGVLIFPAKVAKVAIGFGGIKEDSAVDAWDVVDGVLKDRRCGQLWVHIAFVAGAYAHDLTGDACGFKHGFV